MKRATLRVTYPPARAHPIHRRIVRGDGVTRAELLLWGPTSTVTTLTWYDGDRRAVESLLDGVDSLATRHLVPGDGGTYAFVHQTAYELDEGVMDLVTSARAVFPPPVVFRDDGDALFEAVGEATALADLYAGLDDELAATVERVEPFGRGGSAGRGTAPSPTTDRQRAALEAAVALGYYDVPRTATVADVAAELDCAPSTAGELLRKAEAAILTAHVAASSPGGHP